MNRVLVRFAIAMAGIALVGVMSAAAQAGPVVRFTLNYTTSDSSGSFNYFDVELFDTTAPITVTNFLQYVNNHLYDNTIIHRDAEDFVMQGGGFTPRVVGGSVTALDPIANYGPIQNEFSPSRSNVRGTIAMAKLGGDPDSASNQWFVNLADNSANLDAQNGGFTSFGRVLGNGMTLIDAINKLPRSDLTQQYGNAFDEVPRFNNDTAFVTIKSAVRLPATGKLSGVAFVDMNHNGIKDGADYAIADAQVSLLQPGSGTPLATVRSAADGSYHFSNLDTGTYSVQMLTPSYVPGQNTSNNQVVLDRDGNIVSQGTAGTPLQSVYSEIPLVDGQTGVYFSFAESAYPVSLISTRMLLNAGDGILPAVSAASESLSLAAGDGGAGSGMSMSAVPEPGSLVLLAVAGLFLGGLTWRRRATSVS